MTTCQLAPLVTIIHVIIHWEICVNFELISREAYLTINKYIHSLIGREVGYTLNLDKV
jgi:hypothetical protein